MSFLTDSLNVLRFYLGAKSIFKIHSPFLFELVTEILDEKKYYDFDQIEEQREALLRNKNPIVLNDLGAGSKKDKVKNRTISSLAKSSLSTSWQCQIMYRLVNKMRPKQILELGTSLGISTAYLGMASKEAQVYTMEGNKATLQEAQKLFKKLGLQNIEGELGNFDNLVPRFCERGVQIDLAFLDGNHRYQATMDYFESLLNISSNQTIFIIDDIYWSVGMKKAWKELKEHKRVRASLDFYLFGLIFLDDRFKEEKHLKVIPHRFKPWQKYF